MTIIVYFLKNLLTRFRTNLMKSVLDKQIELTKLLIQKMDIKLRNEEIED